MELASVLPYVFMAWCLIKYKTALLLLRHCPSVILSTGANYLIKHRDKCAFTLTLSVCVIKYRGVSTVTLITFLCLIKYGTTLHLP
jgi:hypothetical protein